MNPIDSEKAARAIVDWIDDTYAAAENASVNEDGDDQYHRSYQAALKHCRRLVLREAEAGSSLDLWSLVEKLENYYRSKNAEVREDLSSASRQGRNFAAKIASNAAKSIYWKFYHEANPTKDDDWAGYDHYEHRAFGGPGDWSDI